MDTTNSFYKFWLMVGFVQLAILSGCSGKAQSTNDTLFSNTTPQSKNNASERDPANAVSAAPQSNIVRLSRAYFEKSLAGKIQVQNADSNQDIDSNVEWIELPTTEPAPTGPVIADLREHWGCATYSNADNGQGAVRLCFNIIPDVSSVGVNATQVQLQGAEQLAGCNVQNVQFGNATLDGSQQSGVLTVHFTGTCDNAPVAFHVTLRQI